MAFFQRRSETYGAEGSKSSCWRSMKISSKTGSGSFILPISSCHWWYSSSVTCNDAATGFSFSSCWLTSIERKFDLSWTLSSHRRINIRSYSASRLLSASGSSFDAATSRRMGIFSSLAPLRNRRSLIAVSRVFRMAGPAFQISSRKTISASGR